MYSGVRPTISPPTNTVMIARIKMPYRPAPTPPGATSPSIMLNSTIPPPNAVYESWKEFTAPVEVTVVDAANSRRARDAEPDFLALHRGVRRLRGEPGVLRLEEA